MDELGVRQISDEEYIAIGKAAVMWNSLSQVTLEHEYHCPAANSSAPRDSSQAECDCGVTAFEDALDKIWDD
jgi:hypothetical protein